MSLLPRGLVHADDSNIFIRPDGTVDPSNAPIQTNGNVYTLTGNVDEGIVILKSGITLDGGGYMVNGSASSAINAGVETSAVENVTIENLHIGKSFQTGIMLANSSGVTVVGNFISDVLTGIELWSNCSNNIINQNSITNVVQDGVEVTLNCSRNVISNNTITDQPDSPWQVSQGIIVEFSDDNTITQNIIATTGMGGIELQVSNDNNLTANNLQNSGQIGIYITGNSNGNYAAENNVTGSSRFGILLEDSSGNTLSGNHMSQNAQNFQVDGYSPDQWINAVDSTNTIEGQPLYYWVQQQNQTIPKGAEYVFLVNCTNVTIQNLTFAVEGQGATLFYSTFCSVTGNTVANNATIDLYGSSANQITQNTIIGNSQGIYLQSYCYNNLIANNTLTNNNIAISLSTSSSNTLTQNTFANNTDAIYFSSASSNNIYLNNFENNTQQVNDAGLSNPSNPNYIFPLTLSSNNWDNGKYGNYWSSYNGSDTNGDGIGDSPYYFYGNNQDNYPLMSPVKISITASAPASPTESNLPSQTPNSLVSSLPTPTPSVPEFPFWIILSLIAIMTLIAAIMVRRKLRD